MQYNYLIITELILTVSDVSEHVQFEKPHKLSIKMNNAIKKVVGNLLFLYAY